MQKRCAVFTVVTLFVLPFAFVAVGVIPVDVRRWVYVIAGILAIGVVMRERWTLRDLGFRWDTARPSAIAYGLVTLIAVTLIVAVSFALDRVPRPEWWLVPHFRYGFFLPISAAQELFYRSILMLLLRRISTTPIFLILANASLFAFLHVIFPDPWFVIPGTFALGVVLAWLWIRYPNFWIASLAHTFMNAVFVLFCFGSFDRSCIS